MMYSATCLLITSSPLHDVLSHVPPDHLQPWTITVGPNTATLAPSQDSPGPGLGILWELVCVQQGRVGDEGQHLPDKSDGLVPHGMSISNIGLDYRGEWFLNSILQLLFNCSGSDDKRSPDCILHLLDAGVHVVQGYGGGHDGAACVQGTGTRKENLSLKEVNQASISLCQGSLKRLRRE